MTLPIPIDESGIVDFCKRWQITEFALFGSVLREDFAPESDIDVLVTFEAGSSWNLWDLIRMQEELKGSFDREVHIVEKSGLDNPYRRHEILKTMRILHAA